MPKNVEIRHYNRFGRPVRWDDRAGLYVLKIIWHRDGHELLRTERSGWLKAMPMQPTEFTTWQELWDWVAQARETAAAPASKRGSRRPSRARRETRSSPIVRRP